MNKVILDTDPGVDDAMAIAYALCHPEIELLALTTVFGNTSCEFATRNAQYILNCFGATDVAVARGCARPSVQEPLPHPDFVHGADGLGMVYPTQDVTLNAAARHANVEGLSAPEFIIEAARAAPGEISLVAVGPLTNVAAALALEPELPSLLKQLVVMGGTVIEPGNVSPVAEANFWNDPHAADQVMAGNWPLTIVGLDVTHQIMIGDSHLAALRDQGGDTGNLIWDSSRFYVNFYSSQGAAAEAVARGEEPKCAMHDAAAIAFVIIPEAFESIAGAARVIPDGMGAGQLVLNRAHYEYPMPYWRDRPDVMACMQVDDARVRGDFFDTIIAHHLR